MWKKSSTDFHKIPQDKISRKSVRWDPRLNVRGDENMEERTDGHPDTVSVEKSASVTIYCRRQQ
jgi:hypothetical protein